MSIMTYTYSIIKKSFSPVMMIAAQVYPSKKDPLLS